MSTRYRIGEWEVDASARTLRRAHEFETLTPRAMDVLMHFAAHPGEVITGSAFIHAYWPRTVTSPNALQKIITELRHALHDDGGDHRYIETVPKRGYRLVAAVTVCHHSTKSRSAFVVKVGCRSALVQLARADLSATERDLLDQILRGAALRFVQRADASAASPVTDEIYETSYDYHVELDAHEMGGRLLTTLLITPSSNELPGYAEQFESTDTGNLEVLNTTVSHVVDDLFTLLDDDHLQRMREWGAKNVRAYRLAREGAGYKAITGPESQNRAAELFQRALREDPRFNYAFVSLSSIYESLIYYARDAAAREQARLRMRDLMRQAQEVLTDDGVLANMDAHYRAMSVGTSFDAEELWRGKILKDAHDVDALCRYAHMLGGAKLTLESDLYLDRATRYATSSQHATLEMYDSVSPHVRGDLEAAIRLMKRTVGRIGDNIGSLHGLVRALAKVGRYAEAESYLARLRSTDEAWANGAEALLWALRGDIPLGSAALARTFEHPLMSNATRGHVCFILGDVESGVRYWRQIETPFIPHLAEFTPINEVFWAPHVVQDPRYQAVLDELGAGRKWRAHMREKAAMLTPFTGIEVTTPPPPEDLRTT